MLPEHSPCFTLSPHTSRPTLASLLNPKIPDRRKCSALLRHTWDHRRLRTRLPIAHLWPLTRILHTANTPATLLPREQKIPFLSFELVMRSRARLAGWQGLLHGGHTMGLRNDFRVTKSRACS